MTKLYLKYRFTKYNVTHGTMMKIIQMIGPFHNFLGINTVQFIETRIIDPNKGDVRLVNTRNSIPSEYVKFIKSFLRTYSDGILTPYVKNINKLKESYIEKDPKEDFTIDFQKMRVIFFSNFSAR